MKTEDAIRDVLEAQATSVAPTATGEAWNRLQHATDGTRRRRRSGQFAVAAAAILTAILAVSVWSGGSHDTRIRTGPAESPPDWTIVSDADPRVSLAVPDGWQQLEPGTSAGGIEILSVGTTVRPSTGVISACFPPIPPTPGSYISVYEYRPDTPLAQPLGGGAIHPSTFEPRPAEFVPTHRGGSYCTADGRAASYAEVDNWLSFHYFSEGGRRFLVRIVTITDPGGKQQEIATRILNTLTVTPLTTGITQPPPPPTTLDDAAVRAQLADVHVFETGECANPPDGTIVSCSEPHMIEYFATYSYPGVAFFGPLAEGCGQLFEEYTGHERNAQDLGYSWGSELLNPETVANGTVDVRCVITSISGTPPQVISMTGSALHTNG